jgi:hypothetical protein
LSFLDAVFFRKELNEFYYPTLSPTCESFGSGEIKEPSMPVALGRLWQPVFVTLTLYFGGKFTATTQLNEVYIWTIRGYPYILLVFLK